MSLLLFFGLDPKKMIGYGLQAEMASLATHILSELPLEGVIIFIGGT